MFSCAPQWKLNRSRTRRFHFAPRSAQRSVAPHAIFLAMTSAMIFASLGLVSSAMWAQQTDSPNSVIVQPGAPGTPTRTLPPSTKATLPPRSHADVEFMQGMIMHHAQAVEMTALIASHTENKDLWSLGAKISRSQSDEIKFMKRWLAARGEALSMPDMGHMTMATSTTATTTTGPASGSAQGMMGMDMSHDNSAKPMATTPGTPH